MIQLPRLSRFVRGILGYDTVPVAPLVQPHLANVPLTVYDQGRLAIPPITEHGFTTAVLTVPPVGFATPNPVEVHGLPPTDFIPGGTSPVYETDAQGGMCK